MYTHIQRSISRAPTYIQSISRAPTHMQSISTDDLPTCAKSLPMFLTKYLLQQICQASKASEGSCSDSSDTKWMHRRKSPTRVSCISGHWYGSWDLDLVHPNRVIAPGMSYSVEQPPQCDLFSYCKSKSSGSCPFALRKVSVLAELILEQSTQRIICGRCLVQPPNSYSWM